MKFSYAMLALFLGSRSQSGNGCQPEKKNTGGDSIVWWCGLIGCWLLVVIGCLIVHYWLLVICCYLFGHVWSLIVGCCYFLNLQGTVWPTNGRWFGARRRREKQSRSPKVRGGMVTNNLSKKVTFSPSQKGSQIIARKASLSNRGDISDVVRMLIWWKVNCWSLGSRVA